MLPLPEGLRPKKRFGQHFLVSPATVARITEAALAVEAPGILEVGPGEGVLTAGLLSGGRPVWAIELDPDAQELLRSRFSGAAQFHLLPGDAVTLPLPPGGPWSVVGNLPYNAATAILTRFLVEPIPWQGMVFMFQLEVGQKLLGRPGEKAYGPLSVMAQLCTRMQRVARLGPGAFHPPPKVESIVLAFTPAEDAPPLVERAALLDFLHACFAHRRKTLANNLSARLASRAAAALLADAGIPPMARAESLAPERLLALFRCMQTRRG